MASPPDFDGITTAGGLRISHSDLDDLPVQLREAIFRGVQVGNIIEEAIARLAGNPTHGRVLQDLQMLDRAWRGVYGAESDIALALCIATLFDAVSERRSNYDPDDVRGHAADVVVGSLARHGYVECSAALGARPQLVKDTLGVWWGEIRGSKWAALARLLKTTMGIKRKPDSLRVEYAEFKTKARTQIAEQKKLLDP